MAEEVGFLCLFVSKEVQRFFLTKKAVDDKLVIMDIQDTLKELIKKKGLRRTARELDIDSGALYRSIHSDLRLSTAQAILNLFGYDLKIVKRKEVKPIKSKPSRSRRN